LIILQSLFLLRVFVVVVVLAGIAILCAILVGDSLANKVAEPTSVSVKMIVGRVNVLLTHRKGHPWLLARSGNPSLAGGEMSRMNELFREICEVGVKIWCCSLHYSDVYPSLAKSHTSMY